MKGLILGGDYLRREICVFKSIGPALKLEINLPFLLCLYLRAISSLSTSSQGLISGGAISRRVFCVTALGAYIWRGLCSEFYGTRRRIL